VASSKAFFKHHTMKGLFNTCQAKISPDFIKWAKANSTKVFYITVGKSTKLTAYGVVRPVNNNKGVQLLLLCSRAAAGARILRRIKAIAKKTRKDLFVQPSNDLTRAWYIKHGFLGTQQPKTLVIEG
jgi:hypothetical protein